MTVKTARVTKKICLEDMIYCPQINLLYKIMKFHLVGFDRHQRGFVIFLKISDL